MRRHYWSLLTHDQRSDETALPYLRTFFGYNALRESASQTRARSMANADHLANLDAIWPDETTRLEAERYRRPVLSELRWSRNGRSRGQNAFQRSRTAKAEVPVRAQHAGLGELRRPGTRDEPLLCHPADGRGGSPGLCHRDDELPPGASRFQVTHGVGRLVQRIALADDRGEPASISWARCSRSAWRCLDSSEVSRQLAGDTDNVSGDLGRLAAAVLRRLLLGPPLGRLSQPGLTDGGEAEPPRQTKDSQVPHVFAPLFIGLVVARCTGVPRAKPRVSVRAPAAMPVP